MSPTKYKTDNILSPLYIVVPVGRWPVAPTWGDNQFVASYVWPTESQRPKSSIKRPSSSTILSKEIYIGRKNSKKLQRIDGELGGKTAAIWKTPGKQYDISLATLHMDQNNKTSSDCLMLTAYLLLTSSLNRDTITNYEASGFLTKLRT